MLYLDYLAYTNALSRVSVFEKALLGGGGLVLTLFFPQPTLLTAVIIVMHVVMLIARAPFGYLVRLWLAPLAFLLLSMVTVMVSVLREPFPALVLIQAGPFYLGVTAQGLETALALFLRSTAAVSCMFMLAITTPVAYLVCYLSRVPGLRDIADIALLTYRFIFVFLAAAGQIWTAQHSRLGYAGGRRTLRSLSLLAANLGRKAALSARELYIALQARNYTNRLVYQLPRQKVRPLRLLVIILLLAGLTVLAVSGV